LKRILQLIRRRWVVSALGIAALGLVIWLVGPLVSIAGHEPLAGVVARALLIAVLVALWVLHLWLSTRRARRGNQEMLAAMAEQGPGTPAESGSERQSREEVAELQQRFDEALAVLKRAKLGKEDGGQYLYQLPWYLIIGPPGAGKTTALLNCGLNFPLGDRLGADGRIRGVGGTRNCDWWFTDEAVLLDTAGRYTTQDSQADVDRSAWQGFLALLKRHRRRRPINGVLVAVSVGDLLLQTESEIAEHTRAIKQRVQELHRELGVRFPVYVLFTKCDLLAGFVEFFDDLGQDGRSQVWGTTFPAATVDDAETAVRQLGAELTLLEQRVHARVTDRLQNERDLRRRDLIYGFPRQLATLRPLIERFVTEVFQASRFEIAAMLRGVYFTSGTQEGAPIDRLMGALAGTFGIARESVARFSGAGRSYFLSRLFREVVFREAALAGTDLRAQARQLWRQRGAYAGAVLLTVLAGALWLVSYARNQTLVDAVGKAAQEAQAKLDALAPGERDVAQLLPALDALRGLPAGYGDDGSGRLLGGLGLSQADKLGPQARAAYQRALGDLLLPAVMTRMEEQLRRGEQNLEFLYETLKAYLMLGDHTRYDAESVRAWVLLDWQQTLARDLGAERRARLEGHLDALLGRLPDPLPLPLDQGAIAHARAVLGRVPLAARVYARVKTAPQSRQTPEFKVSEAVGRDAAVAFVRKSGEPLSKGVPGLYTVRGYRQAFQPQVPLVAMDLLREGWVLGGEAVEALDPLKARQLEADVSALYYKDYISHWEAFLTDLDLMGFASLRQGVDVLAVIGGRDSPLKKLLTAVAAETTLEAPGSAQALAGKVTEDSGTLSAVKSRLSQLLQGAGDEPATPAAAPPPAGTPVDQRFAELHRLVKADGGPAPIDAVIALLDETYVQLNSLSGALDRGATALDAATQQGAGGALGKLKLAANRQPAPLNEWMKAVAENGTGLTLGSARGHVNAVWTSQVLPFCKRALGNRYPFARGSAQDVTLDDFARLFGPGGLIDGFFQKYLSAFVDTTQKNWQWRVAGDSGLGASPEVLRQFQRAAEIKEAFFGASPTPQARFQLRPLSMDASIERLSLDIDGQPVVYSHGPARATALVWPGPGGAGQVTLEMAPPAGAGSSAVTLTGPWAWFRLLDQSSIQSSGPPEEFRVTFSLGGRNAVYAVTAGSVVNPFRLPALRAFSCPDKL
jgi:type VI secretion system protein ImpL